MLAAVTKLIKNTRLVSLLVAVTVAAVCLAAREFLPFVAISENWVSDLRVARLTQPRPQNTDIVVVTITEDTLSAFPYRSPVDRSFLSELLRNLRGKGVRAIGIDILFDQATEPVKDAELRDTLRTLGIPVVVGRVDAGVGLTPGQLDYMNRYLDGVETGLALLSRDDVDGKIRSIFLGRTIGGEFQRGFSAELARRVGAKVPPGHYLPLQYYGDPRSVPPPFSSYPAHGVALLPRAWFEGKIALIGADLSLTDRHATPFNVRHDQAESMPGVMIHAHSLAQILDGRTQSEITAWQDAGIVFLFALTGVVLASTNLSPGKRLGLSFVTGGGLWFAGLFAYQQSGIMLPLIPPTMGLVLATGSQMTLRWHGERKQKLFIRGAFARFLSPWMVDQLIQKPEALSVTGERRPITSLFTDIANFTTLMEGADPSVMVPVLNNYLDEACRIVHRHGGTIDKIVGDALVVFFNAPMDQPDHADRAVACALDLDRFSQDYRASTREQGIELGCTRIGINSGSAIVGNFGGYERFAYTAYGDTVNTAARFEGANKYFGTRISVGAETVRQVTRFHFRPIGRVVLKGKSEAVETFEPIPEYEVASAKNSAYMAAYHQLERHSDDAGERFAGLARQYPDDPLIQYHAERLKPRGEPWAQAAPESSNLITLGDK